MYVESCQTLLINDAICEEVLTCTAVCSVFLPTMYVLQSLTWMLLRCRLNTRVGELKKLLKYRKEESMTRLYMPLCQETEILNVFFCDQCLTFVA
jgi:hypothetical protein